MEWYRIANLIMQAIYMPLHLALIMRLIAKRQPTPIWRWFIVVVTGLWVMISGRLLESVAYMFFPSNGFYTFAVYYQLVGTTFATSAYLIWNLYLARHDIIADSRSFKAFLMTISLAVSLIVCTNGSHHLFYEKLVMGEQVVHGKLFFPCLLIVYGTLFIGWLISVIHIVKHEKQKAKRLVVFSLYPILPAAAALIRSIAGVDKFDYMPVIMTVSVVCLYLLIFRYRYVDIVSQSVDAALERTKSALLICDPQSKEIKYANHAAKAEYQDSVNEIILSQNGADIPVQFEYGEKSVKLSRLRDNQNDLLLIMVTDMSDILDKRRNLDKENARQLALVAELEENRRNIDAYLDALYLIPDLREKQERIITAQKEITRALDAIRQKLMTARDGGSEAEPALNEGADIARQTLTSVREAVAALREAT